MLPLTIRTPTVQLVTLPSELKPPRDIATTSCIRETVGHATQDQDTETLYTGITASSSDDACAYDIEHSRQDLRNPRNSVKDELTPMWKRTTLAR